MNWFRGSPRVSPGEEQRLADELRSTARKLTGWTMSGATGADIPALLDDAAYAIEALLSARETERS